jgi:phospholipid/cholesterol/gamma-HCH transport system substrate-binding protein
MNAQRRVAVGAFVVGGVLLFGVGLFLIGDRRLLFQPNFELNTSFNRVSGVQVGTRVRVDGLDAGEVLGIRIPARPSERFGVRMRIREDLRPLIRADSVAAVQTDGIVGNAFIQVGRGTDASPLVRAGDTIAGTDPIDFSDLIQEGRQTFRTVASEMTSLTDEIAATIDPLTETIETVNQVVTDVGDDVKTVTAATERITGDAGAILSDTRAIVADIRGGRGTIGRLLTDESQYERWVGMTAQVERTVTNVETATGHVRSLVEGVTATDGATQRMAETLRETLTEAREVMSDLSEGTEALKRNFLFRGFFRDRGFFDLDAISREAYASGALEGGDRTRLRIWIDADVLFSRDAEGREQLTPDGRRRLESAMADLMRYPRDAPLVVEGYADGSSGEVAYLVSADRALLVREFLLSRFRRRATLTGIMPMSDEASGSPRADGRWSGVALALFVPNGAFAP